MVKLAGVNSNLSVYMYYFQQDLKTVELVNVAVLEEQHNRGIGKQLVMDAMGVAKVKGYKTIEIGTGNSGIGQLALYQKCGFRIIGVDMDFLNSVVPVITSRILSMDST